MKRTIFVVLLGLALGQPWGGAQTAPIYINSSPVISPPAVPPQIDATAFVNRSIFSIDRTFSSGFNLIPYETYNTSFFTNTSAGAMIGVPGFRFEYTNENVRVPMAQWINQGSIVSDSSIFFITGANTSWLLITASNIVNSGRLSVGSQGLLKLEGKTLDLARAGLRSGSPLTNAGFFFGSSVLASNYVNDVGISDLYWGTGTNNAVNNSGMRMALDRSSGLNNLFYNLPFPQSPYHQVIQPFTGFNFTNLVSVPGFASFGSFYTASVFTNRVNATNLVVQVVFMPTNVFDTNFTGEVRFYPDFSDNGAMVVVGFHSREFDIISQSSFTNSVFLIDALAFETNLFLARNLNDGTRRPSTYDVTRNDPFFGSYTNGNAVYSETLIYNPFTYASNQVQMLYAGYQAQLNFLNVPAMVPAGSPLTRPTNFPGRVEILADSVNLERATIRADSTLILRSPNVRSNKFALVDAPFLVYDIGTTQPLLVISNMAPASVRRLSGTLSAWSGTWRNFETNTTPSTAIDTHVLIVDSALTADTPVSMDTFRIKATNTLIFDSLNVAQNLNVDTRSLDLRGNFGLPNGSNWGATNFIDLYHLTNGGIMSMTGSGFFGSDRPLPYTNFVNTGTVVGASIFLTAENFDNPGTVSANGGLLSVSALRASLLGKPTVLFTNIFTNIFFGFTNTFTNIVTNSIGATLASSSDIELAARELVVSNSILQAGLSAPGTLMFSITNRLTDSGTNALNFWENSAGIRMLRKPAVNDLLATHLRCSAAQFYNSISVWPADDLGPTVQGYSNNLALGKLILDAKGNVSLFSFSGTAAGRALYVDYIQLENFATNYNATIEIDPGFTIYFADANVSARKLNGAAGGRFRWVSSFAGPNSSTNVVYPSGQVYVLNRALVTSNDLDSDGDGVPNGFDPTPVFVAESINLSARYTNGPSPRVLVGWNALALGTNRVDFATSLASGSTWQVLTQFVMGQLTVPVTVEVPVPSGAGERFYRVQINPRQ